MDTNTIMAIIILVIGFCLFAYGLFAMGSNDNDNNPVVIAIIGFLIVVVGGYFSYTIVEENKELLTQEVAVLLNTTPEKVIIKDESKTTQLFSSNETLSKVFYDKKVYLLEVDGYEIVKLVEVKGE